MNEVKSAFGKSLSNALFPFFICRSSGSYNRRFSRSGGPWQVAVLRRSVQDGNNKPSNAPFDLDGIAGRIDDTDELIYHLSLIVKAQFIPHGQMIADLRVVCLLVQLQFRDAFHQLLLFPVQLLDASADICLLYTSRCV